MADDQDRVNSSQGHAVETSKGEHYQQNGGDEQSNPKPPTTTTVSQVPFPQFQKLANPGPLGLLGFAVTTFVLGLYQCGAG